MKGWVKVEDELPPITESFKDGTNYHGKVVGWFPQFYKMKDRETILWTSDETEPRWMVSSGGSYGPAKIPPTHWTPLLEGPT